MMKTQLKKSAMQKIQTKGGLCAQNGNTTKKAPLIENANA